MEPNKTRKEIIFEGVPASPGVAHGWSFVYIKQEVEIPRYQVDSNAHKAEIARFEKALLETRKQISDIRQQVVVKLGEDEARIFDAHLLVLEDVALIDETIRAQKQSGLNIEVAFYDVSQRYIDVFKMMDDNYIKERVSDIQDVAKRVLNVLLGQTPSNMGQFTESKIIVAEDLEPSTTATLDKSKVLGIITDKGSRSSHAVIMARSLQVPAVVGLHNITEHIAPDDYILVDGYDGKVIVNPTENTLFTYGQYQRVRQTLQGVFESSLDKPSTTLDGHSLKLMANIGGVNNIDQCKNMRAEGVGLFRTESIFLGRTDYPTEEEQYIAYKQVVERMNPLPVVIRTLDLGGDKKMANQHFSPKEENPFMGLRAVRFCLENPRIFKDQLRAILRAGKHGNMKIMYPMISGLEELKQANALLETARQELRDRGDACDYPVEIGIMIEIPAAVMIADILAQHCSFFSIGTNDLIQYTLAVDRVNDQIAHLYEPSHPAILRSLKTTISAAQKQGIKVCVCGEMASDPLYLPLLLGVGVNELSLTAVAIPEIKYLLRNCTYEETKILFDILLEQSDGKNVLNLLKSFYDRKVKENKG